MSVTIVPFSQNWNLLSDMRKAPRYQILRKPSEVLKLLYADRETNMA
jgi:hypothetical protein